MNRLLDILEWCIVTPFDAINTKKFRQGFTRVLCFALIAIMLMGAGNFTQNMFTEKNGKVEQVFADAGYAKKISFPAGWCEVVDWLWPFASDGIRVYEFDQGEILRGHFHLPHGTDLSTKFIDLDFHYGFTTSENAVVKLQIKFWHVYEGRVLVGTPVADFTKVWTITTTTALPAYTFEDAFEEDSGDLTSWETNRNIHDEVYWEFKRLEAGDGDTLVGKLGLFHGEVWWPADGTAWYGN